MQGRLFELGMLMDNLPWEGEDKEISDSQLCAFASVLLLSVAELGNAIA